MLPALDVAPPLTEWGAQEVAIDAFHHIVYAIATGVAYPCSSARRVSLLRTRCFSSSLDAWVIRPAAGTVLGACGAYGGAHDVRRKYA